MSDPTPQSTPPVLVGVAGVGAIGRNHARIYAGLPQAKLSAIYDADVERAKEFADQYGATAAGTHNFIKKRMQFYFDNYGFYG